MKKLMTIFMTFGAAGAVFAGEPSIRLDWRYQDAMSGKLETRASMSPIPVASSSTDPVIEKTIYLVKVATTYKELMAKYHDACAKLVLSHCPIGLDTSSVACSEPARRTLDQEACTAARKAVAERAFSAVDALNRELNLASVRGSDVKVLEALDLGRKLAANMREQAGKHQHGFPVFEGRHPTKAGQARGGMPAPMPAPAMPRSFGANR